MPSHLLLHGALESGVLLVPSFLISGLGEPGGKFLLRKVLRAIFREPGSSAQFSPAHVSAVLFLSRFPRVLSVRASTRFSSPFLPRVRTEAGKGEGSGGKAVSVRLCFISLPGVAGGHRPVPGNVFRVIAAGRHVLLRSLKVVSRASWPILVAVDSAYFFGVQV